VLAAGTAAIFVAVVFIGVAKASFGGDTATFSALSDTAARNALQSRLQSDLSGAARIGLADNTPCSPAPGGRGKPHVVLWTRAPADPAVPNAPSTVDVYYTQPGPGHTTLLLHSQCRVHESDPQAVAPEGDRLAQWPGKDAVVVRSAPTRVEVCVPLSGAKCADLTSSALRVEAARLEP
jgi:hypothetical protein